jgi:hypothetical protein
VVGSVDAKVLLDRRHQFAGDRIEDT